jgi:hypothetical protein
LTARSATPLPSPIIRSRPNNPLQADELNFYKIEKWTRDGSKVDSLIYAGSNLDKARAVFADAINHRLRIRLTIRQGNRVLEQWPKAYVHNGDGILFKLISVTGQQHLILFFHPQLPASKTDFGQSTLRSLYGVGAG